jgi:phospholipid/cholesterol/gamma-HCH transport system substrate-binding protein
LQARNRDLAVGTFVLLGLLAIAYLSIAVGGASYGSSGGLTISAEFDEIGGLTARSPVVIGGVKVGTVESIRLGEAFRPIVQMNLDAGLKLPEDTSASILTQGVLGDQYIGLEPGGSEVILKSGDQITMTQSAVILERLIGRLVQNFGGGGSSTGNKEGAKDGAEKK